jgi:L-cysteine desulfidase
MEVNAEAGRVYHIVKRQVRTAGGSGEIIDLDYAAVKAVMDIYGIADQKTAFEKISQAFHHFLAKRRHDGAN